MPEVPVGLTLDVTTAQFLGGAKMDALQARERLRRRYLFPRDAVVQLDREGYAGPGEAPPLARSESRRGSQRRGAGHGRPRGPVAALPSQEGPGFVFSRLTK